MASLRAIREGLRAQLQAALPHVQVSAYALASPTPPCVYVVPTQVIYHEAMGPIAQAVQQVTLSVRALVQVGLGEAAQVRLDELVDAGAIPAAIESDPTLGGVVDTAVVTRLTRYDPIVLPDAQEAYLAEWEVVVSP